MSREGVAPHPYFEAIVMRRQRVVELTRQGHSAAEISQFLGITKRSVTRIRRETGVAQTAVNVQPMTDDELRRAAELLDDGCSYSEVGRTLGRSGGTIRAHFPGRGWPRGEGSRLACFNRWAKEQARKTAGIKL